MFGRKKQDQAQEPTESTGSAARPGAKNRPTPSRKEAEAARRQPLVPADRKAAERASKDKERLDRQRAREAMYAGEQWALMPRDRGEDKAYIRDVIDARWSIGEFLLPIILVALLLSLVNTANTVVISMFTMYGMFLLALLEFGFVWLRLRRAVNRKFGYAPGFGILIHSLARYMQLRGTRVPRPRVARGQKIV